MKNVFFAMLLTLTVFSFPAPAEDVIRCESLELTLDSGETIDILFKGDGIPGGFNRFEISCVSLDIDFTIDDEFLGTSIIECSNTDDLSSPDRLSIMATSFLEMMFVPYMGPMPPQPLDYSIMSDDYKEMWERTLGVFGALSNEPKFKNYVLENTPDLSEDVANAIAAVVAGYYMPTYTSCSPYEFNLNNIDLNVGITYGVGNPILINLGKMQQMYRIVEISGDQTFNLNSTAPAWTPDQEISIGSMDKALMGIIEVVINPANKTFKVTVDGESLPELMQQYMDYKKLYCASLGLILGEFSANGTDEKNNQGNSQEEMDRLKTEIENITADLQAKITIDRWAEGFDYIKETLTYLETQFPKFNEEWLKEKDLDIEVQVPIVLEALNSYTPEIEIQSWTTIDAINNLAAKMKAADE